MRKAFKGLLHIICQYSRPCSEGLGARSNRAFVIILLLGSSQFCILHAFQYVAWVYVGHRDEATAFFSLTDVAEEILNKCTVNDPEYTNPDDLDYCVAFNYEFIEDTRDDMKG